MEKIYNKILIQGAEPHETEILENVLENKEEFEFGGYKFFVGNYLNKEIVVSRTRVGEINSAAATTLGIVKFNPDIIINQGTAGGHGKNIHKGDIIIGSEYFQLNSFYSEYKKEGEGFEIRDWIFRDYHSDEESVKNKETYRFANKDLVEKVYNTINLISNKKVYKGIIGSGDVWNRECDRILYLNEKYNTLCEEMETAGCYKVANNFNVPAISIRIVSNNEILKEEYEPNIAKDCQEVILKIVEKL